jgi:two-component system, chemotaxis family, chemotaxis protein CheY
MKRVLVVDDSETIRREVAEALGTTDFEVVQAVDGLDGLARVADNPDLSIVLLDVNMPKLGGLAMLEQLNEDPKTRHIPVLILTTEVERPLLERARKAGAKAWLIKPIKPELLLAAVTKFSA